MTNHIQTYTQTITPLAVVGRIIDIRPHIDPEVTRLEIISVAFARNPDQTLQVIDLVTGKHYCEGDLGVWLRPGAIIPGWLANDLWLVGKKRLTEPFEVREMPIRGVNSPGLWAGQWYKNDSSKESLQRENEMLDKSGAVVRSDGWIKWGYWNSSWRMGDEVDVELGVTRPSSSVAEHLLVKQEVADSQNAGLGSTPAVGSND